MNEQIRTSFIKKIEYPQNDSNIGLTAIERFVSSSQEIVPFSAEEEKETIRLLEKSTETLENPKRKPILHLAFGSKGITDGYLTRSIPENIKNDFYEKAVIVPEELKDELSLNRQKILEQNPENIIFIPKNGAISQDNALKLQNIFIDRIGIIIGGGPYSPTNPIHKPVIMALEKNLEKEPKTIGGICLGHQLMGILMGSSKRIKVTNQWYEKGPIIEESMPEGQKHEVVKRFGKHYVTVMAHAYSIIFPKAEDYYQILSKNVGTGEPVSIGYNEKGVVALTTQAHPEWGIGIKPDEPLIEGPINIEINGQRIQILEPGQSAHADIVTCAKTLADNYNKFSQELQGFSVKSIKDILNPERIRAKALGIDFFGPLIMMMVKNRLSQTS